MTPSTLDGRTRPEIVTDRRFRDRVRGLLVVLPNNSPGLGLKVKVSDSEKAVLVFPRAGRSLSNLQDLLALTWYEVDAAALDGPDAFIRLETERVREFLEELGRPD